MALGRGIKTPVGAVLFSLVAVILVASLVMVGANQGQVAQSAGVFPKNVRGYVEDLDGNGIEGADVIVDCHIGTTGSVRTTKLYTTIASGLYQVTFQNTEWLEGDMIVVTATYDVTYTNQNSTIAEGDSVPIAWVNVTLSFSIPEFGELLKSPVSVISLGMIAFMIVVIRRRRNAGPLAPE